MPVKSSETPSSLQAQLELESAILSKTRGQAYYTQLNKWLEDQPTDDATPQQCSAEMMKKIITVLQKELQCLHFQQARVIIAAIQHVALFKNVSSGLPALLSSGLVEILVYTFQVTCTHISKSVLNSEKENEADQLMETILETVNDIADYSAEGKELIVIKFVDKLIGLIVDDRKIFRIRMEAQRTLNLLLENCPSNLTQSLTKNEVVKNLMKKMSEMLATYGDFEMQVACTEALARLVTKLNRPPFAAQWFADNNFASSFLAIRDLNFETDCRKFLNFVNDSLGAKRSVHSIPCKEAFLGNYKLIQPPDENLSDFWVDFNSASQSITMYVAEVARHKDDNDGGMWETVTIKANDVKKYSVTKQTHFQKLHLNLTIPGKDILHFCPSSQKAATILFDTNIDLAAPLAVSLGEEKRENFCEKSQKKASVCKINVRVSRTELNSIGPINGHPINDGLQTAEPSQNNATSVHNTPQCRLKVSVPIMPMKTPNLIMNYSSPSSVASSRVSSVSAAGSKTSATAQPKTPTRSHSSGTKKVKTPLQIIVADKLTTDTESDILPQPPRSTGKISMPSTIARINTNQHKKDTPAAKESFAKETPSEINTTNESKITKENCKLVPGKCSKVLSSKNTNSSQESNVSREDNINTTKSKRKRRKSSKAKTSENSVMGTKKESRQTRSKKFKLYSNQSMLLPEEDEQKGGRRRSRCGSKRENSQDNGNGNSEDTGMIQAQSKHDKATSQKTRGSQRNSQDNENGNSEDKSTVQAESKHENETTRKTRGSRRKNATRALSQEELVIPSSVPATQDSANAVIIPASGSSATEQDINGAERRLDAKVSMGSSVQCSPCQPTITEKSTRSNRTNSTGKTAVLNQRNTKGQLYSPDLPKSQSDSWKTSRSLQKNEDKKQTNSKINLNGHSPPEVESEISLKPKNDFNSEVKKGKAKMTAIEYKTVPESQLSQDKQTKKRACNTTKKQGKQINRNANASIRSIESKQCENTELTFGEDHDPYIFTDTESIYSIRGNQSKGKKQVAQKETNKQALKDSSKSSKRKTKENQNRTHSFSPEPSQESPLYQSQNDFRSPVELSTLKGNKLVHGKGKCNKKTNKSGGKSKSSAKKMGKQDNTSCNDSLSDVEIMRDASISVSSIRHKHGLPSLDDNEAIYLDEEMYDLSDDFTKRLNKSKADLEKFLATEKNVQLSLNKKTICRLERSLTQLSANAAESDLMDKNSKKPVSDGKKSYGQNKSTSESNNALKDLDTVSWKKQYAAGKNDTKQTQFDSSLLKFPTRSGLVSTDDMLIEESKKMKKKKITDHSPKVPFNWDDTELEQDVSNKITGQQKKTSKRNSDINVEDVDINLGTEGFDVVDHGDDNDSYGNSRQEETKQVTNQWKALKSQQDNQQNRSQKENDVTQKKKNLKLCLGESDLDEVSGHEDMNDEHNWSQELIHKSKTCGGHQKEKKQIKTGNRNIKGATKQNTYGDIHFEKESEGECNMDIEKDENFRQSESVILGMRKQRNGLVKNQSKQQIKDTDEEVEEYHLKLNDLQKEKSRKKGMCKVEQQQEDKPQESIRKKSGVSRKRNSTDYDTESYQESDNNIKLQKENENARSSSLQNIESVNSHKSASTVEDSDISVNQKSNIYTPKNTKQREALKKSQKSVSTDEDIDMSYAKKYMYKHKNSKQRQNDMNLQESISTDDNEIDMSGDEEYIYKQKKSQQRKTIKKSQKRLTREEDLNVSNDDELSQELYDHGQIRNDPNGKQLSAKSSKQLYSNLPKSCLDKPFSNEKQKKGQFGENDMNKSHKHLTSEEDLDVPDDDESQELNNDIIKDHRAKQQSSKSSEKSSTYSIPTKQNSHHQANSVSISSNKQQKSQSRMFGSQIVEAESDEIAEEQTDVDGNGREFDTETVASVESFHNLCKKLLQHSGGGIATTRKRRQIPKVNYQEAESSEIESTLSGSNISSVTQSNTVTTISGSETNKTSRHLSEETSPSITKRQKLEDSQSVVSNRSWLIEKPKQKVTTYSKTRAQQWIGVGPPVNLDTLSGKKKMTKPRTGGIKQAPPALPKKKKRAQVQSEDDEDNTYMYYFRQDELQVMEDNHQQPSTRSYKANTTKTKKSSKQQEEDELDDIEVLRSQQSRHNVTPISRAMLDYNTASDGIDLCPILPVSTYDVDEIPLSQSSIAFTPRNNNTPVSGRTPKLVTFEEDNDAVIEQDPLLLSGTAQGPRPTKSALKRKYADLSDEGDGDEDVNDDDDAEDVRKRQREDVVNLSQGHATLKPKNLFRTSFATALQRENLSLNDDDIQLADEARSSDGWSSWESYNSENAPMAQMTQLMKVIGENMKEKIRRKQNNAQQLTETTIKTAQTQVSKMWAGQHKARTHVQAEFQDKLLSEIVGLETNLNEMENSLHKSQALLQQHQRKVATTLMTHVKKIYKLDMDYKREGGTLEVELGNHLVRNVQGLIRQGITAMQKKMLQDVQHHEIQSMKRSLQSFIL